jgi:CRISPR/Cas system endoribonuclease Cas6 (RAMP superfamily)
MSTDANISDLAGDFGMLYQHANKSEKEFKKELTKIDNWKQWFFETYTSNQEVIHNELRKICNWKQWFFTTYTSNQEVIHNELRSLRDQNNEQQRQIEELNLKIQQMSTIIFQLEQKILHS